MLPFLLAALALAHVIVLHVHGSNNPNGVTSNGDRMAFHPYYIFKDLVTILFFFLVLSIIVFYYPNLLGQNLWPYILLFNFILICAICWKYILYYNIINLIKFYDKKVLILKSNLIYNFFLLIINIVKIYNKTICVIGYDLIIFIIKFIIYKYNPNIVKYYYKICNQQITKVINYLLWVGISETLRTHKNYIIYPLIRKMSINKTNFNTNINNIIIKDSHNNELDLKFREWFAGITDGDGYLYVNKKGNVGYKLTLPYEDEKVLRIIKNKFWGNIQPKGGYKSIRYRSKNRKTVYKIVPSLNGLVVNNIRLSQLHKVCLALNIPIKEPFFHTKNYAYISGLLD